MPPSTRGGMSNSAGRTVYLSSWAAVHHCTGHHCDNDEDDEDDDDDHHHHHERWQKNGKQLMRNSVHINCLVLLLPIIIIDKNQETVTETECSSTSEEKCETAYEEQCTTVYDQQCSNVPGQQQCSTVNEQVRNKLTMKIILRSTVSRYCVQEADKCT